MKKILGLDLGVSSIGWALVSENAENSEILGMGSRIVPLSTDDKNEFTGGNAISKNQSRTIKRTQRKGYDRYQLRRKYLMEILSSINMLPGKDLVGINKLELWDLRNRAVNEKISLTELGRVLLHLNQKRGYKSSRSEANMDKKDTEYVTNVKSRHQQLKELNKTIGQFFYEKLKNDEFYRIKDQVYPREAYIEEFDKIIETQKKYYPELLTTDLIQKIRNEIIYFQRALKSQKELISVCEFEGFWTKNRNKEIFVGPRVAPKSSPVYQVCKIWENINNIRLKDNLGKQINISKESKKSIFEYLNKNEKLTYTELLKILGLNRNEVYGNRQLQNGLQGNLTYFQIAKCFDNPDSYTQLFNFDLNIIETGKEIYLVDKKTREILQNHTALCIENNIENEPFYRLWHTIYSIHDREECKKALVKNFGIAETEARRMAAIDFSRYGFGNKSTKAIRKIMPYLMEGFGYSDACSLAGYNHSNSITREENQSRPLNEKLLLLQKNSLRQPIVEKILNQMINVVNAVIDKYGKPDEIRVELARELKQSREERADTDKAMRRIERENQDIRKKLEEYGIRASRNNVIKWRLYHEINNEDKKLNACCVYCGKPISITAALNGDEIDVEHIIPKSRLFDDSQSNKTLSHRKCNEEKGNDTAFDYMKKKSEVEFLAFIDRVNELYKSKQIGKAKRDKLLLAGDKIPDDFIDRQLRESQYIAKKAREILMTICKNVWATSGKVTAELRHTWGWDDVLMNLHLPKYRELGYTKTLEFEHNGQKHTREIIEGWTKRDDHRHHAIDALTIACTKQGFIQRLNTLNASETRDKMYTELKEAKLNNGKKMPGNSSSAAYEQQRKKLYEEYLLLQRPFTTSQVEEAASKIIISYKPGKKVATFGKRKIKKDKKKVVIQSEGIIVPRGPLSEESVYGKIRLMEKKKPLKYIFANPHLIVNTYIKTLVEERLAAFSGDLKKALASVKKEPIMIKDTVPLEYATCFREEYVLKYTLDTNFNKVDKIIDNKVKAIVQKRLDEFNGNPKLAFKDLENNPVWYNKEKKIPIKSVRCMTGLSVVEPVRKNENGNEIAFVKPGNNHHIAIYKDETGKYQEHVCTFWHAVERKKYGIPVVIKCPSETWDKILQDQPDNCPETFLNKLPDPKWEYVMSLQQNEMFLLGLDNELAETAIRERDYSTLSDFLYRVQKLSLKGNGQIDIWFRHHCETSIIDNNTTKSTKRYFNVQSLGALFSLNPIKIYISNIGDIGLLQ